MKKYLQEIAVLLSQLYRAEMDVKEERDEIDRTLWLNFNLFLFVNLVKWVILPWLHLQKRKKNQFLIIISPY